jgi:hypothetical protein
VCGRGADAAKKTRDEVQRKMQELKEQQGEASKLIRDLEESYSHAVKTQNFLLAHNLQQALHNAREAQAKSKPRLKKAFSLVRTNSGSEGVLTQTFTAHDCDCHVGNLSTFVEDSVEKKEEYAALLKKTFQCYGTVLNVAVRIRNEQATGKVSWALVTFSKPKEAQGAIAAASELEKMNGWKVRAVDAEQVKRSTGGMNNVQVNKASATLEALQVEAQLCEIWQEIDQDASNTLDVHELKSLLLAMESVGCDIGGIDPHAIFNEIDQDASGEIDFEELLRWWRSRETNARWKETKLVSNAATTLLHEGKPTLSLAASVVASRAKQGKRGRRSALGADASARLVRARARVRPSHHAASPAAESQHVNVGLDLP